MDGEVLSIPETLVLWSDNKGHEIRIETLRIAARSANVGELLNAHWDEVAHYKDKIPLAPLWAHLEKMELDGDLLLLTVREEEELIGYGMFIKRRHLHYQSLLIGENDLIFLDPAKRKTGMGLKLIEESEKCLKAAGCNKITFHMKPEHSFAPLLERRGYRLEELLYGKLL